MRRSKWKQTWYEGLDSLQVLIEFELRVKGGVNHWWIGKLSLRNNKLSRNLERLLLVATQLRGGPSLFFSYQEPAVEHYSVQYIALPGWDLQSTGRTCRFSVLVWNVYRAYACQKQERSASYLRVQGSVFLKSSLLCVAMSTFLHIMIS